MKRLINKEIKLVVHPITWIFMLFAFITLIPGYPILCGAFFISMGIFRSYQFSAESEDILYSSLLPIPKRDLVTGKYAVSVMLELIGFAFITVLTIVRMTLLADTQVLQENALMPANPAFLGWTLLLFLLFNLVFIGGYFRNECRAGKPYLIFVGVGTIVISAAEIFHALPAFAWITSIHGKGIGMQMLFLAVSAVAFFLGTFWSMKSSQKIFEQMDL